MNLTKTLGVSVISAAVIALIAGVIFHKTTTVVQQLPAPATEVVRGAPDLSNSPYININGHLTWEASVTMRTASTSLCNLNVPLGTSTLAYAGWDVYGATSSAAFIDFGTSTSRFATTSDLNTTALPANNTGAMAWYPVLGGAQTGYMLYSSTATPMYLLFMENGGGTNAAGLGAKGRCDAIFNTL